jgi:hypothetical protein
VHRIKITRALARQRCLICAPWGQLQQSDAIVTGLMHIEWNHDWIRPGRGKKIGRDQHRDLSGENFKGAAISGTQRRRLRTSPSHICKPKRRKAWNEQCATGWTFSSCLSQRPNIFQVQEKYGWRSADAKGLAIRRLKAGWRAGFKPA